MKEQKLTQDPLERRRYNCAYDEEDILSWKQWIDSIEKPINSVLIVSIFSGCILTVIAMILTCTKYYSCKGNGMYFREIFLFQLGVSLLMGVIMYIGNKIVLYNMPRPALERCLEAEYYNNSVKFYYFYRKGSKKIFVDEFFYDGIEVVRLGKGTLLVNGRKIYLQQTKLESLLSPTEQCKYEKYYGYLQGIHRFHYDFEPEKLIYDIYFFRDAMQVVHDREKKE